METTKGIRAIITSYLEFVCWCSKGGIISLPHAPCAAGSKQYSIAEACVKGIDLRVCLLEQTSNKMFCSASLRYF